MKKINELMNFIDNTPNAYCATENIKDELDCKDYTQLFENEEWNLEEGKGYYVIRNDSSIIAFQYNGNKNGFNIVATHSDSPSFIIKANSEINSSGYLRINTQPYGQMINYSWFDRPLSLAGRVILKKDDTYLSLPVNIDQDLLVIPSLAIHMDRQVNEKATFNRQIDMLPITTLYGDGTIEYLLEKHINERGYGEYNICDYDLYLYNRDKGKLIGDDQKMLLSPRLDDLGCVYPALSSFIGAYNINSINVLGVFNNEEIGSMTMQGADSSFLADVLYRISISAKKNIHTMLDNSFVVSADNGHALHPAHPEKDDESSRTLLNRGILIKHHTNYTTDALSSSLFKGICDQAKVKYQDYSCRSDMISGATLGCISQTHVSVPSVDIGLPQLAMHSANELVGVDDVTYMRKALATFYQSSIEKESNMLKLKIK